MLIKSFCHGEFEAPRKRSAEGTLQLGASIKRALTSNRASSAESFRGWRHVRHGEFLWRTGAKHMRALAAAFQFHCGERLITGDDAVRKSIARRSTFERLTGFKRPAASTRLEFFELLVLFEAGILIFPPRPGWTSSSSASNSSELLTLITPVATGGRGWILVLVLIGAGEAGPNRGALFSG